MGRFRAEVSVGAVGAMMAIGALIMHGERILHNVLHALVRLLAQAIQPTGLVVLSVAAAAILAGYAAGLPTRMTRHGGAPPKGALTKVLTPVCVTAMLAALTMAATTWLLATGAFERPIQLVLTQLAQILSGAVASRCFFLMYRISSECRMAVKSADWP